MAKRTAAGKVQAFLLSQPWALALGSAGFLGVFVWVGSSVGWDLWAPVGYGVRHLPLWLLLLLGVPLFGSGVVIGTVRQVRLLSQPQPTVPVLSLEAEQFRSDGPGWLSRRSEMKTRATAQPHGRDEHRHHSGDDPPA